MLAIQMPCFEVMPGIVKYNVDICPSVTKRIDRGSSQAVRRPRRTLTRELPVEFSAAS